MQRNAVDPNPNIYSIVNCERLSAAVLKKTVHAYASQIGSDCKTLLFFGSERRPGIVDAYESLFVPIEYNQSQELKYEGHLKRQCGHCRGREATA